MGRREEEPCPARPPRGVPEPLSPRAPSLTQAWQAVPTTGLRAAEEGPLGWAHTRCGHPSPPCLVTDASTRPGLALPSEPRGPHRPSLPGPLPPASGQCFEGSGHLFHLSPCPPCPRWKAQASPGSSHRRPPTSLDAPFLPAPLSSLSPSCHSAVWVRGACLVSTSESGPWPSGGSPSSAEAFVHPVPCCAGLGGARSRCSVNTHWLSTWAGLIRVVQDLPSSPWRCTGAPDRCRKRGDAVSWGPPAPQPSHTSPQLALGGRPDPLYPDSGPHLHWALGTEAASPGPPLWAPEGWRVTATPTRGHRLLGPGTLV